MEKVQVGIITKPQALKGEFRVKPTILNLKQFKKFEYVTVNNHDYKVEKATLRDTFAILKLEGIDSCEEAESLRNMEVFAEMEIDTDDSFDLVGFEVIVDGNVIGKISEINNYGSKDIISIVSDRPCMLPIIDNLIISTDENNQTITLDREIFDQVVVYEN